MSNYRNLEPREAARLWREHACTCVDDFLAADAEADAALEAVADAAARGDFRSKDGLAAYFKLNTAAFDAEHARRRARNRLSLALCMLVNHKALAAQQEEF